MNTCAATLPRYGLSNRTPRMRCSDLGGVSLGRADDEASYVIRLRLLVRYRFPTPRAFLGE